MKNLKVIVFETHRQQPPVFFHTALLMEDTVTIEDYELCLQSICIRLIIELR